MVDLEKLKIKAMNTLFDSFSQKAKAKRPRKSSLKYGDSIEKKRDRWYAMAMVIVRKLLTKDAEAISKIAKTSKNKKEFLKKLKVVLKDRKDEWKAFIIALYLMEGMELGRLTYRKGNETKKSIAVAYAIKAKNDDKEAEQFDDMYNDVEGFLEDFNPEMLSDEDYTIDWYNSDNQQRKEWLAFVLSSIESFGDEKSDEILDTRGDQVNNILQSAQSQKLDDKDSLQMLTDMILATSLSSVMVIATTEVVGASNFGMYGGALRSMADIGLDINMNGAISGASKGQIIEKEWVAILDDRTRPGHEDADGQIVPMDQPFEVALITKYTYDMEYLMFPGDASMGASPGNICNCRCTVRFYLGGQPLDEMDFLPSDIF